MSVVVGSGRWNQVVEPPQVGPPPSLDHAIIGLSEHLKEGADAASWWTALARHLDRLIDALWEHRTSMERPSGLYGEVLVEQPRYEFLVTRLESEHVELIEEAAQLRTSIADCMGHPLGVERMTRDSGAVVERIQAHLRRGNTMVHDAYECDLGDGD